MKNSCRTCFPSCEQISPSTKLTFSPWRFDRHANDREDRHTTCDTSFLPSPSRGEPLDNQIGEQRNRGSDDDRSNEHGCVNIPPLLQNVPQSGLIQRHWMLHRENQVPQLIFSQPYQGQKREIENRSRRPGDSGDHVPLQQPRHNDCSDCWGWIQRNETGKDADGEASSDLVRCGIEVRQLLPNLSGSLFQGDS
jgi:hypothetical protein